MILYTSLSLGVPRVKRNVVGIKLEIMMTGRLARGKGRRVAAAIDALLTHTPRVMVQVSGEGVMMKDSMSKRVFDDAGFLYMLRGILAAACENLRGKSFRDEVAELGVFLVDDAGEKVQFIDDALLLFD